MDTDCVFNVLQYLNNNNIAKCLMTCKIVKSLNTEYLWKCLNESRYEVTIKQNMKWYNMYKEFSPVVYGVNKKLFEIFGDKADEFKNIMAETNAVISGSFIIQKLLGGNYENSDIDIYLPANRGLGKSPFSVPKTKFTNFFRKVMKWTNYTDNDHYGANISKYLIEYVRTYKENGYIVQFIYLNVDNNINAVYDYIKMNFDFDICKNIYYYNGEDNVILYNSDQIFNKYTEFKACERLCNSIERYYKYMERGFMFTNINKLSYKDLLKNNTYISDRLNTFTNIRVLEIEKTDVFIDGEQVFNCNDKLFSFKFAGSTHACNIHSTDKLTLNKNNDICNKYCPIKLFNPLAEHYHNKTFVFVVIN